MTIGHPPRPGASDIEVASGKFLNLADPEPEIMTLEVIAHHLAFGPNRYAGAPRRALSVAEHTLLVAAYLNHHGQPPEVVLGGLHHDDSEAFLGDATRPLKELLPDYRKLELKMTPIIVRGLGLDKLGVDVEDPAIKEADHWALAAEAFHHMPTRGREWWCWGLYDPDDHRNNPAMIRSTSYRYVGLPPSNVVKEWISVHDDLVRQVTDGRRKSAPMRF